MLNEPQEKNHLEESKDGPTQTFGLPQTSAEQQQPPNNPQPDQVKKRKKPRETLIPPLDIEGVQEVTNEIELQLKKEDGINEEFLDDVIDTYSPLNGQKDRLKRFIKHHTCGSSTESPPPSPTKSKLTDMIVNSDDKEPQKPVNYPQLPKVSTYEIKKTLIKWIVENEANPTRIQVKKFGLTLEQFQEFRDCYNKFGCITFEADDKLLKEERDQILACLSQGQQFGDIQNKTKVHPHAIWIIKFLVKKLDQLTIEIATQPKPPTQTPPTPTPPTSVSLTPPLSEQDVKDLKQDINDYLAQGEINDEQIDELAQVYSLIGLRDELVRFIKENFCIPNPKPDPNPMPPIKIPIYEEPPKPVDYPQLPNISSYEIKKTLIKFIVNNEVNPTKMQLKNLFGGLTLEQLQEFKDCYNKYNSITFEIKYLFPEEKVEIMAFLKKEKKMEEITSQFCVHPYLVWLLQQGNIIPIPEPIPKKLSLIPPLNEEEQIEVDFDIIEFVKNVIQSEAEYIDDLLKAYSKLEAIKPQVIIYVRSFYKKIDPILKQFIDWPTKCRIIDQLKKKEPVPNKRMCIKLNLIEDQLQYFQRIFQNYKAISLVEQDLCDPEEKMQLELIFIRDKNSQSIQEQTLITEQLVRDLFEKWSIQVRKEDNLFKILNLYGEKNSSYYVDLILKDNYTLLLQIILRIYKKSKKNYTEVIKTLSKYNLISQKCDIEVVKSLGKVEDLLENEQKQNQVKELLKKFENNDIIIYLMVLHDLWLIVEKEELSCNSEKVILKEKHQEIITAIAQLEILNSKDESFKAKVAEKGEFIDQNNQQAEKVTELAEKLKVCLKNEKSQQNEQSESEWYNTQLVQTIQALAIITEKKIKVHLMSELKKFKVFNPQLETIQDTLLVVQDDINKIFHVMIEYKNEKKIIEKKSLKELQNKLPFLSNSFPNWLETFVELPSILRVLSKAQEAETPGEKNVLNLLDSITKIQSEYMKCPDKNNKKRLQQVVLELQNLDIQLLQEWFHFYHQQDDKNLENEVQINKRPEQELSQEDIKMQEFCSYIQINSARQNSYWAQLQVKALQKYFTIDALKLTLKDFNRVQMRSILGERINKIKQLIDEPKEFTKFIINTMFGFILRKEDLSAIQSEVQQIIKGSPISLRFLIAYIFQSADMGLRSRLTYYLCQNKAVPLIMNCQETFFDQNFNTQYNQELIFSMNECEGVGVFSFGIGKMATFPCGKSEISNMIVTPKFENKSFDTNDMNVLSNGQIDVFFEKCYQKKTGWAYMDGQGQIPEQNLKSILPLTNIVLVHFFEKDSTDNISVEKLRETLKLIKENDKEIFICLILRDCAIRQEIEKVNYPNWIPEQNSIDKLIAIVDLNQVDQQNRQNEIQTVTLYFNTKVRQVHEKVLNQKFTKERFLENFCKSDEKGKQKFQRISETLKIAKEFLLEVNDLKENVFNEKGLPSLKLKDEMRAVNLKLRSFTVQEGEDQETAVNRQQLLTTQLKQLNKTLQELEINTLMQKFWQIVNHKDAVLIKIELSKGLINFTQNNTNNLVKQQSELLSQNGSNQIQKKEGVTYQEIQDANKKFQDDIKKIEEEIFQRSLSYEYFWRSLICVMIDSKKCLYWNDEKDKLNFTQQIRQQMLDGDTFELVDGRNLEMKGDIIREILGNDIECTKCIVACVIGPQSTGKSTLMNFCFGTQFLASTGRCTQGIYFTLQKIPPELKQGKDVEYLIILDTEGLNSPERAEPEYDRKIVMFTLLCSDFLIINSRGDMTYQMKELIKICAVRYDQLRGNAKVPKILYTFVQNSDTNPANFTAQISSLKTDVIECSLTQTVKKTADELMTVHANLVKVMGSAYGQQLIEKDERLGLLDLTYIQTCAPLFGVYSSEIWLEVQNLFLKKNYQFRQIGTWLSEAQDHWTLIERHGAKLVEHENVIAMKNDAKMKDYFFKLWNDYLDTKVSENDNKKAQENSQKIFEHSQKSSDQNEEKIKYIKANDEQKSKKFDDMWSQFEKWKNEPHQSSLTQYLETKHKLELKKKMDLLKDNFKLLLQNKMKEIQMMQINNKGITDLFTQARLLIQMVKQKDSDNEKDILINEAFEQGWDQVLKELSGEDQIQQLRLTSCEYLQSTFKSVNQFMSIIEPQEYSKIIAAADSEDLPDNQGLPKKLFTYLVNRISKDAFINEKRQLDSKDQFKFDSQMLGLLKDPSERIFTDKEQDKYLPLQTLFKVNYSYKIINSMLQSLKDSSFYNQIWHMLSQVKSIQEEYEVTSLFFFKNKSTREKKVDDEEQIIKSLTSLFQDFGLAGFGLWKRNKFQSKNEKDFISLSNLNVEQELKDNYKFNDYKSKDLWINSLKERMDWKRQKETNINLRVQQILKWTSVNFENQIHPKIDFDEHKAQSLEIQNAKWCKKEPIISYVFSQDNTGGKINVDNLMQDNNLQKMREQYFQCLINPVKHELAESQKWSYLANFTSIFLDWEKIILTINEKLSKEIIDQKSDPKSQNESQVNEEFDLRKVLERNQITLKQAENIYIDYLQSIIKEIDDELHNKLALFVHPNLSGVITWVACVIVWYKQQKNIRNKFDEQQQKLESQKETHKNNFTQIAKAKTAYVTTLGASEIFTETFKIFNENQQSLIKTSIDEFFQSADVIAKYDTEKVYTEMDQAYISSAKVSDYEKFIGYVQDPVRYFEQYAESLKSATIEKLESNQTRVYKDRVKANLNALRKRLELIQGIIQKNNQWEESVNLFEIYKDVETVPLAYQDKKKIESELSPIYLSTLKPILEGNFKLGQSEFTLKIDEIETKYVFSTIQKNQHEIEFSPLQDLQHLQFEQDDNLDLIKILLTRLGESKKNFGICGDLRNMIDELIRLTYQKIDDIDKLTLTDICDVTQQALYLKNYAVGCRSLCKFCNRKCERKPHNDSKEGGFQHTCKTRGHQLRVFAGGCLETLWGERYPSLLTCDEIEGSTHIKIQNDKGTETRLWSEVSEALNRNWITEYTKFQDNQMNPVWIKMNSKLKDFWQELGERFCKENRYIYNPETQFKQNEMNKMNEKSIVILCLDDSSSMFPHDFPQAVAGGQEVEKYLQDNHKKPNEVHIQLWYNDCRGAIQVYKGQLDDQIPSAAWVRISCQTDKEIKGVLPSKNLHYGSVGQFTGALRVINEEVSSLLDQDSGYKNIYWFLFSDGGSNTPYDELEKLSNNFKANPKKWTDELSGSRSKLIPLFVTNQPNVKPLVEISNKLNQISKEIWKEDNFCQLKQNVALADLAATMIERFTLD